MLRASPLNLPFYDAPAHLSRHFIRFLVAARSNFSAAEYISFNDQVRDTYAKVATFQCCCVKSHRVSHLFIYEFIFRVPVRSSLPRPPFKKE